jgi:hypothetical protein
MKGTLGKPGVGGNEPTHDCDQALKGQIDFDGMTEHKGQEAKEHYERLERIFGGIIPKLDYLWKDIIDDKNLKFKDMNINAKRELYHNQPGMLRLKKIQSRSEELSKEDKDLIIWLELDNYQISKEEYIKNAKASAIVTFAVIKDGKWYERGSMGWWGIVSDEKDRGEWNNRFCTLISDLPDDTLLSVFDCHI